MNLYIYLYGNSLENQEEVAFIAAVVTQAINEQVRV